MNAINQFMEFPDKLDTAIKSLINAHTSSGRYDMMLDGERYYQTKNTTINARKHHIYAEDDKKNPVLIEDPYRANNRMASSFYKIQVDQKVNYSLGHPVTFETDSDASGKLLLDTLGTNFSKTLRRIATGAAKKCVGWGLVNINAQGEFEIIRVAPEQVIAVYKDVDADELEYGVRFYEVTTVSKDGAFGRVTQVEVWDDEMVTIYRESIDTHVYQLLTLEGEENPRYHFSKNRSFGTMTVESKGISWGKVPLIPFYNNDDELYDLRPIKNYIDVYDIVQSDFANNFEDFQAMYWVLKGYNGTDLNEFLAQVKIYKALKVAADGDAHVEQIEVPHEARVAELQNLETAIYKFGMAVDPSNMTGGSLTNVHIKAMFANLDLKANEFEQQTKDFIWRLVYFVNVYLRQMNKGEIALKKVTFTRSLIINEAEVLESNAKQMGSVSEETRLGKHPWVDNAVAEMKKMQEESSTQPITDDPPPVE